MPEVGTVVFLCKNCGKRIERPADRKGVLVECRDCGNMTRTPSIAAQGQATAAQIEVMERAATWHARGLWALVPIGLFHVALFALALGGVIDLEDRSRATMFTVTLIWVVNLVAAAFVLAAEMSAVRCLGWGVGVSFILFIILWPAWLIRSIAGYLHLRSALAHHKEMGPRPQPTAAVDGGPAHAA